MYWKEFDEAVDALAIYVGLEPDSTVLIQAHRVLDLLAGMKLDSTYDRHAPQAHWVTLYDGCHVCGEIVERAHKSFQEAVLAVVISDEFKKWRSDK